MNKRTMAEYIKDIRTALVEECPRAYYREAPEQKTFPYVVFDVRAAGDSRMVVELDLWSKRGGEIALMELANEIEYELDSYIIASSDYTASFFSNNDIKWVEDEDRDFLHINLSFNSIYQS